MKPGYLLIVAWMMLTGGGVAAEEPSVSQDGVTFHAAPRALAAGAVTSDWASFLGPNHNATSPETNLLKALPARGPAIVWEVQRGSGYAAPAVASGRVVHFYRRGLVEVIECLEAQTGRRLWQRTYPVQYNDRYGYSDGPRCSPVIAGGRVYTIGVAGMLHCLELATGNVVCKRDLPAEFKLEPSFFGVGATPLVEGSVLIVNVGAPGGPSVVGLDLATGKTMWGCGKRYGASYSSPVPALIHGKRRVLVFAGGESRPPKGGLMCLDPASGELDFEFDWRGRRYESVNASSPVVVGDRVFISECYGRGSALVGITAGFKPEVVWTDEDFGTHFMTALAKDGYLYGVHGHGPQDCALVCLELATGKEMWRAVPQWQETLPTREGPRMLPMELNRCQLVAVDGRTLCLTENGNLLWLDLNPKGYRELSRAWLFAAQETWTGPVISHGLLYVCQNERDLISGRRARLICYDLRGD